MAPACKACAPAQWAPFRHPSSLSGCPKLTFSISSSHGRAASKEGRGLWIVHLAKANWSGQALEAHGWTLAWLGTRAPEQVGGGHTNPQAGVTGALRFQPGPDTHPGLFSRLSPELSLALPWPHPAQHQTGGQVSGNPAPNLKGRFGEPIWPGFILDFSLDLCTLPVTPQGVLGAVNPHRHRNRERGQEVSGFRCAWQLPSSVASHGSLWPPHPQAEHKDLREIGRTR